MHVRCRKADRLLQTIWLAMCALLASISNSSALELSKMQIAPDRPALAAIGLIAAGDTDRLRGLLRSLPGPDSLKTLLFNSQGGDVAEAERLATLVHADGVSAGVAGGNSCINACALVFLAATHRLAAPDAVVGIDVDSEQSNGPQVSAALVRHAGEYNIPSAMIAHLSSAAVGRPAVLSSDELVAIGTTLVETASAPRPPATSGPERLAPTPPPAPLPLPLKPATPSVEELEASARDFMRNYLAKWSLENASALPYLDSVYAPDVELSEGPVSRSTLMQRKEAFATRWPIRVYTVRPGTLHVTCDLGRSVCEVGAVVDWDRRSDERGAASRGSSRVSFSVSFESGRPQIERERVSTLSDQPTGAGGGITPPFGGQTPSPYRGAAPAPAPAPEPAARDSSQSTAFAQGFNDRQTWERWFSAQSADFRAGAYFWSGQRSLPHPAPCSSGPPGNW